MPFRLPVLCAAAGLALLAGGCGTKVYKQDELQDTIADDIAKQVDQPAKDLEVSCPDDAEVKTGKTFTCEVSDASGDKETVRVTPTDDDGNFRYEVTNTLHVDELERQLTQQLSAQAGADPSKVSVDCPDGVQARKGRRFACTLTTPQGDKLKVVVTLTDDTGRYTATIPQDAS